MGRFVFGELPRPGPSSPTLVNQASGLGSERASRNSNEGDQENGGFGPGPADFVRLINDMGFAGHASYGGFVGDVLTDFTSAANHGASSAAQAPTTSGDVNL